MNLRRRIARTVRRAGLAAALVAVLAAPLPAGTGAVEGPLGGEVTDGGGAPLSGVMITAYDGRRGAGTTVFTDAAGRFGFPELRPGSYRVTARRIGFATQIRDEVAHDAAALRFALPEKPDFADDLPAAYWYSQLEWPDVGSHANFARACANCHQIGDWAWRVPRDEAEWEAVLERMDRRGPPLYARSRAGLIQKLMTTFGPDAPAPDVEPPAPPSGAVLRAVIREYEVDLERGTSCHDLEPGADGRMYTEEGYWLDPRTLDRGAFPIGPGAHSIERAANGDFWITVTGSDELVRLDPETGQVDRHTHPEIDGDRGVYPHTLRFDARQQIWYTLTASNHLARFDPRTAKFEYHRLPGGTDDPEELSGAAIAYGSDIAPDQSIWWSQLLGPRIGRYDPASGEMQAWTTPYSGPRRLRVAGDGMVWVPFFGHARLGRFDPRSEEWKTWELPTGPAGTELPYALAVHPRTGDVWITGSNSDTLIRFRPATERFDVFPLPTPVSWTREIEFDTQGHVWTCTSDAPIAADREGVSRFIELELPAGDAAE